MSQTLAPKNFRVWYLDFPTKLKNTNFKPKPRIPKKWYTKYQDTKTQKLVLVLVAGELLFSFGVIILIWVMIRRFQHSLHFKISWLASRQSTMILEIRRRSCEIIGPTLPTLALRYGPTPNVTACKCLIKESDLDALKI